MDPRTGKTTPPTCSLPHESGAPPVLTEADQVAQLTPPPSARWAPATPKSTVPAFAVASGAAYHDLMTTPYACLTAVAFSAPAAGYHDVELRDVQPNSAVARQLFDQLARHHLRPLLRAHSCKRFADSLGERFVEVSRAIQSINDVNSLHEGGKNQRRPQERQLAARQHFDDMQGLAQREGWRQMTEALDASRRDMRRLHRVVDRLKQVDESERDQWARVTLHVRALETAFACLMAHADEDGPRATTAAKAVLVEIVESAHAEAFVLARAIELARQGDEPGLQLGEISELDHALAEEAWEGIARG